GPGHPAQARTTSPQQDVGAHRSGGNGTSPAGHGAGSAAAAKTGLTLTAKLVIGAALLTAAGTAGGIVFSESSGSQAAPTAPLHVRVVTDVMQVDMPGTP